MRSAAMPLSGNIFLQSSVEHDSPVVKPTLPLNFVYLYLTGLPFSGGVQGLCPACVLRSVYPSHAALQSSSTTFPLLPCLLDPLETSAASPLFYSSVSLWVWIWSLSHCLFHSVKTHQSFTGNVHIQVLLSITLCTFPLLFLLLLLTENLTCYFFPLRSALNFLFDTQNKLSALCACWKHLGGFSPWTTEIICLLSISSSSSNTLRVLLPRWRQWAGIHVTSMDHRCILLASSLFPVECPLPLATVLCS